MDDNTEKKQLCKVQLRHLQLSRMKLAAIDSWDNCAAMQRPEQGYLLEFGEDGLRKGAKPKTYIVFICNSAQGSIAVLINHVNVGDQLPEVRKSDGSATMHRPDHHFLLGDVLSWELGKGGVFVKCCSTKMKVKGDFFLSFFVRHPLTGCGCSVPASPGQTHIASSTKHLFTSLTHTQSPNKWRT